jgi:alpha-tubulin suppressor-like RCC1 family protein
MVAALGMNTTAYAGGEIHAIAVAKDGSAFTFGTNFSGQLGNTIDTGTFTNPHPTPSMVALPAGVKGLPWAAAGERYSAVLADDGNVYMWGGNLYGQQANKTNIGNMTANPTVHAVPKPTGVTIWKSLGGGYSHLLTVAQDDQLWTWGDNRQGQLGIGMTGAAPDGVLKAVIKPTGVNGWTYAVGGRDFTLAMTSAGALYAWGANDMGQLAAAGASQPTPTLINLPAGATGWRKIAAGKDHAVAITSEGKLYAWGNGSGSTLKEVAPPTGVASWLDVSAGVGFVLATGADGKVYQWATGGKPAAPMAGLP